MREGGPDADIRGEATPGHAARCPARPSPSSSHSLSSPLPTSNGLCLLLLASSARDVEQDCRLYPRPLLTRPAPFALAASGAQELTACLRPRLSPPRLVRQPTVYRTIIDDVIANVRADFDEFGVEEDILALLQQVRPSPPILSSSSVRVLIALPALPCSTR